LPCSKWYMRLPAAFPKSNTHRRQAGGIFPREPAQFSLVSSAAYFSEDADYTGQ
jgi:hypothetical protein